MNNPTHIKLFIGVLLFATWVTLVVCKVPGAEDIIDMIKLALAGLGVYHLNDRPPAPPAAPVTKEAGMARFGMLLVLAAAALLLSGCAGIQQAVQAYGTVAVTNARAANDTLIEAQKVTLCGLPLSAIARHPEIIPAVRTLCVASADASTNALLDAVEPKPVARQ